MPVKLPRVSREARSQANDVAIQQALLSEITEKGWDAVTVSSIAKRAGVSVGAIYARAENLPELGNQLWTEVLGTEMRNFFGDVVNALGQQSTIALKSLTSHMRSERRLFSAALELVIASLFDDELEEVVGVVFRGYVEQPGELELTAVQRAAFTLSSGFLLGQALARKHYDISTLSDHDADLLCSYWSSEVVIPDLSLQIPLHPIRQDMGDDANLHARAIVEVIAKRGYRKATISRMARAQGVTPGAIFGGYKSKAELVNQAAQAVLLTPMEVWEQYAGLRDSGTSPLARALFLREYMNPKHENYWKIALELARVSESTEELAGYKTPDDALQRTHLGMALMAAFSLNAWELPYYGPFMHGSATT